MKGELERLATAYGIQHSYKDLQERDVVASPESVVAALRAMGAIDTPADVSDALKRTDREQWDGSIPDVIVVWDGKRTAFNLRLSEKEASGKVSLRIDLEDGDVVERDIVLEKARVVSRTSLGREAFVELSLAVPPGLPFGYHRLQVDGAGRQMQAWVISAPSKTYAPEHGPAWGVFLPLYALHSSRSWGIGDYTDLKRLTTWAGSKGASVVATLPLLPTFLDDPFAPSPYEAVSRLFWNEVYVDPEADFGGGATPDIDLEVRARARELTSSSEVDYAAVMRVKREVMRAQSIALDPGSEAAEAMQAYLRSRPEVGDYAAFRAAIENLGPDWRAWPERQRSGQLTPDDYDAETARYFEFAQWRASSQMHEVADLAASQGMRSYLDLPVGVHQQGYDAWRFQDVFAGGVTVGAPPDLYAADGQNWGFQPLNPFALRRSGYDYVARYLRHYFNSAKMLRIDHAIGLHRLYWIPDGATGRDGVFVRQPSEELYAVLCLESMRYQAVVVAENLGLVPPEVDRGLKQHGISGMHVQMFEMTGRQSQPTRKVPQRSVASFSTHDLPTFAAFWEDRDLDQRLELGLLPPDRVEEEKRIRSRQRKALVGALMERGLVQDASDIGQLFRGSTVLLAESRAEWVLLDLEDAWNETRAQNMPGTSSDQHPNWVGRAAYSLDQFESLDSLTKAVETIRLYRPPDGAALGRSQAGETSGRRPMAAASGRGPTNKEGV